MDDAKEPCRLYLLTPPQIDMQVFPSRLKAALDGAADVVGAIQLRLKDVDDDDIKRCGGGLLPICQEFEIPLIVNDRPDLAKAIGADGVHIGQQDASYDDARQMLGEDAVVGVTCHDSRHLALEAGEAGADYVAFGAFYPSVTKEAKFKPEPELLEWWSTMTVLPCVAIGGITPSNCGPLVAAGADYLAVISSVWAHPDGETMAIKQFANAIGQSQQ